MSDQSQTPRTKKEFYDLCVKEFNLDIANDFTNLFAHCCAWQDRCNQLKGENVALAERVKELEADRDMWLQDSAKQNMALGRQIARAEQAERRLSEVAARERERCAKVCDKAALEEISYSYELRHTSYKVLELCAAAIRTLGAQESAQCVGYPKCDGDLVGEPHAPDCPAQESAQQTPCSLGEACPDANKYGDVHPAPAADPLLRAMQDDGIIAADNKEEGDV